MRASEPSAIVFDLDGVLADSTGAVERAWRRWAVQQRLAAEPLLAVVHGRPSRDVIREFAPELDADEQAELVDRWEVEDAQSIAPLPGALECVEIARRGAWAVVTSGGHELATGRLRLIGAPIPEILVTADDVANGKPHPEPYELASRRLGIAPADCLVVEDTPAGIDAARAAGMRVLGVSTTHPREALRGADLVLGSMEEVRRRLMRR